MTYLFGVAVDASGNIFVADTSNHRIQKIVPTGQYTYNFIMMWGSSGSGQSQFSSPYGVALTSTRIYVVDTNNSRLQTFDLATTAGWAYNQIGNMTLNDGKSYTYGSGWAPPRPPQPHAVWNAGGVAYQYDDNGNMTNRGGVILGWTVENRLEAVAGGTGAIYVYDGNGFRVKKTEGVATTVYVNKYFEKKLSDGTITLYYYLGDKMVAFKEGTTLRYIHQEHLSSTSVVTDASGTIVSTIKYKAYGEARGALPDSPAQKFTGQRFDTAAGLYYYNARYYDRSLARFVSADPYVQITPQFGLVSGDLTMNLLVTPLGTVRTGPHPDAFNNAPLYPQALNRYSYVLNNPLAYVDPYGWWTFGFVISVQIAFVVKVDVQAGVHIESRGGFGVTNTARGAFGVDFSRGPSLGVQVTTNPTVKDMAGEGPVAGVRADLKPYTVEAERGWNIPNGDGATSVTVSRNLGSSKIGGLPSPPVEAYAGYGRTDVIYYNPDGPLGALGDAIWAGVGPFVEPAITDLVQEAYGYSYSAFRMGDFE